MKVEANVLDSVAENYFQRFKRRGQEYGLLHRDLAIAKKVQNASFQQHPAVIQGLEYACFYKPAHCIGGDYYDFLSLEDGFWVWPSAMYPEKASQPHCSWRLFRHR